MLITTLRRRSISTSRRGRRKPWELTATIPKLRNSDGRRAGLVDASATSKWRLPATVDQAEHANDKWERVEPVGPKVDEKTGRVIPESNAENPSVHAPKGWGARISLAHCQTAMRSRLVRQAILRGCRQQTPRRSRSRSTRQKRWRRSRPRSLTLRSSQKRAWRHSPGPPVHSARPSMYSGFTRMLFRRFMTPREIIATEYPEQLPEGAKVELTRPQTGPLGSGHAPILRERSGGDRVEKRAAKSSFEI